MLTREEAAAAASTLRALLAMVEAGKVEASAAQRDHLAGAAEALEQLLRVGPVR